MSKAEKVEIPKTDVELELEELAKEDDGSDGAGVGEEEETEGEESEEEAEGEESEEEPERERDPKTGRFKPLKKTPAKKDGKASDDEEEEESEEEGEESEEGEEGEESEEGEEGEEEGADDKGPKSRSSQKIRQLVESRNKANERIAALEGQLKVLTAGASKKDEDKPKVKTAKDVTAEHKEELDALYEKVEEARADSDVKAAAKHQRRIDEIRELIADTKLSEQKGAAATEARQAIENEKFDTALDYLLKARPVLDENSKHFDRRVFNELSFQVRAYEGAGMTPHNALRRACALHFVEDPFDPPKTDADTSAKSPEKKKTDVKKNAETERKQAPRGGKHVQDEGTGEIDPDKLTDEELLALPPAKLARLDGSLGN